MDVENSEDESRAEQKVVLSRVKRNENMITELNSSEFYKIKHLTDDCRNIEAKAVASGVNPGRIYVDDADDIKAALLWIQGQSGYQLIGDAQSEAFRRELRLYMETYVRSEWAALQISAIEIGAADDPWEDVIQHMAGSSEINCDVQHVFMLNPMHSIAGSDGPKPAARMKLHADGETRVIRIDEALFKDSRLNHLSFVTDKINSFWTTVDAFLEHGLGCVVVHDEDIVSVCLSAFVEGSTHAVDIETLEGYRKQNYAALAAQAYMEQCNQAGIHPYWDCSPDNTGSIRLAQNIGLSLDFNYLVYWYTIS